MRQVRDRAQPEEPGQQPMTEVVAPEQRARAAPVRVNDDGLRHVGETSAGAQHAQAPLDVLAEARRRERVLEQRRAPNRGGHVVEGREPMSLGRRERLEARPDRRRRPCAVPARRDPGPRSRRVSGVGVGTRLLAREGAGHTPVGHEGIDQPPGEVAVRREAHPG